MKLKTLYKSLDELPIHNWIEFNKTGDKELLVKQQGDEWGEDADTIIYNLLDRFFKSYAKNADFLERLDLMRDLTVLLCENIQQPDGATEIYIKDAQAKLDTYEKTVEHNFYKEVAAVSKFMGGMYIDTRKVTVTEYYGYIELMKEHSKLIVSTN